MCLKVFSSSSSPNGNNNDDNTIAIETAITDNGKSGPRNANPKFRNSDYVAMPLSLLDCKTEMKGKIVAAYRGGREFT